MNSDWYEFVIFLAVYMRPGRNMFGQLYGTSTNSKTGDSGSYIAFTS